MKKTWFLIVGFVMGAPLRSGAESGKGNAPPKVEESTSDTDKAAARAAAADADKWAADVKKETDGAEERMSEGVKKKTAESPSPSVSQSPTPSVPPSPAPPLAPSPAQPSAITPSAPATPRRSGLNEMKGKLQSKSYDPKTLRVLVDGGFNVEFTFDGKTMVTNGGHTVTLDDLEYNDELIVRYSGKELYALEIERVSKASRPQ